MVYIKVRVQVRIVSTGSGSFNLCSIESVASNLPSTGSLCFSPTTVSYLSMHCQYFSDKSISTVNGIGISKPPCTRGDLRLGCFQRADFFTTTRGKEVIARGWKKSEIVYRTSGWKYNPTT